MYGRAPEPAPIQDFKLLSEDSKKREYEITLATPKGPFRFRLLLFLPANLAKPVPAFLLLNHRGTIDSQVNLPFFPVDAITSRGYAAAGITLAEFAPDNKDRYRDGIIGLYDGPVEQRSDAWRTTAAWAWGGQRALDALLRVKEVDGTRIAVIGHSRSGKAALWCGAQDERFALTISNNSGETGAALARRKHGETIVKINTSFPYWFATNYKEFNDREDTLPVDQHELLALLAPRLAYVASASEDDWADPLGEFLSCVHASPVYRLLGTKGLLQTQSPGIEEPLYNGDIGYHIRRGKHGLERYDWDRYMDFTDRKWPRT